MPYDGLPLDDGEAFSLFDDDGQSLGDRDEKNERRRYAAMLHHVRHINHSAAALAGLLKQFIPVDYVVA
jgi:hypothetical protein